MRQITILLLCFFSAIVSSQLHAQTLNNTNWKTYIDDPLHDTITLHIRADSTFVTTSDGVVVVRSHFRLSGDTLTIEDYEGQYACLGMIGKYQPVITGDLMILTIFTDPCEGRAQTMASAKWKKVPDK